MRMSSLVADSSPAGQNSESDAEEQRMDQLHPDVKMQRYLVYNDLLPYADQLKLEARQCFAEIKGNFGRAVMHRDVFPSVMQWTNHLLKYLRLYGRSFTKDDHIALIKIAFEMLIVPDLELAMVQRLAVLLTQLLKKRELISRDELTIPWRPLYELYERAFLSSFEQLEMLAPPANIEESLRDLIRASRVYFSVESTQEMLDEWKPLIYPYNSCISKAMNYFELFLPTTLLPKHHDKGFKLWFDEFMDLWNSCHNTPLWENSFVWLFSRLAQDNIGYIDWEPYIPVVFTRILRSFNLPVAFDKVRVIVSKPSNSFDATAVTNWIAAQLGGGSSCQSYISKLFKALESFYHPSNTGTWKTKLQRFLQKLPLAVVKRVNRERYRNLTWETPVPKSHKLTDADITEFVKSMKPIVLLSMFSKNGSTETAMSIRYLSVLRPEIIIPPVLERMYSALETLTEPHRLTASMQCVVATARPLVSGGKHFPDGPSHVVPLLMSCLPGIDPNDIRKSMVTFQFVSTFVALVPIADCSAAVNVRTDLSEYEQELCLATASFEDFVLQFMDRCFCLIQNYSLEHPTRLDRDTERMTAEENIVEVCVTSAFNSVLTQCSPQIYESALSKLHSFVSGHIFETKVAGKLVSLMCRSAAKLNPSRALGMFLPHFGKLVLTWTDNEEVATEEILNNELLFSLLLMSEVVRSSGCELMKYAELIEEVLNKTLHLISREGYRLSAALLCHVLHTFTVMYTMDFRSISIPWEECLSFEHHLPLRDWGKAGNIHKLGINWHIPSSKELAYVQHLLEKYLLPELITLDRWTEGKTTLTREELHRTLNLMFEIMIGAGSGLPLWNNEEPIKLVESSVPLYCPLVTERGFGGVSFRDGRNVREVVALTLRRTLDHMMKTCEDDTKSLFLIIKLYRCTMFYWGITKEEFDSRWKGFHVVKKALENKLLGSKQHIRTLLVDRTMLQHEMRLLELCKVPLSPLHKGLMADLLTLSTSYYSEVRSKAQELFQLCLRTFPHAYRLFLPDIISLLKNETSSDEQFKGALYTLLGHKHCSLLLVHDWKGMLETWPAIVQARASEKPSIIKLQDQISVNIQKYFETIQLTLKIPDSCVEAAKKLWDVLPQPAYECPSEEAVKKGAEALMRKNERNLRNYHTLIDILIDLIENGNLHWRRYNLALILMNLLVRYDLPFPPNGVRVFVRHLIHERIILRKVAIIAMCGILKQQKRKHPKREVQPEELTSRVQQLHPSISQSEPLPSNACLQYSSLEFPDTKDKWDKAIFVHRIHYGFYEWPKQVKLYSPDAEQPKLDRSRDELNEAEKEIYDCFSDEQFVQNLFKYLSLEEKKGHDKFDAKRFNMFKGLFRNYGDTFLPLFEEHLRQRVEDSKESMQRCAAEIISALISGSKHWEFSKMQSLKEMLTPLLKTVLSNLTTETLADWGTCIATAMENRSPNKYYWLLELLMEDPLSTEGGSFLQASRLYLLHGALLQQKWRVCELHHRLLTYLLPHLKHPYQNVRERIGSLLSNMLLFEIKLPRLESTLSLFPKYTSFIPMVVPQLNSCVENTCDSPKRVKNCSTASFNKPDSPAEIVNEDASSEDSEDKATVDENANLKESVENAAEESAEKKTAVNKLDSPADSVDKDASSEESAERKATTMLLKTVCKWLTSSVAKSLYSAPPEIFQFLPILCYMQNNDLSGDELYKERTTALAVLGQAYLLPSSITVAINTLEQIMTSCSWHSRSIGINYLQLFTFSNLFTIMKEPTWVKQITTLVINALQDDRLEVREVAAEALGGLLHCEFLTVNKELLDSFKLKSSKILNKKRNKTVLVTDPADIIERHAGILGLSACVNAFPYEVPEFMPDVLMVLGDHLHDPQPIPITIKKTLSNFRRTHHDSWQDHKLKFTDDQLAVITDLLVSPSYYA